MERLLRLPPLNCVLNQLGCVSEVELFLNVRAMRFDRLNAEMELFGNLAGAVALADEAEHFEFAIAQILNG